MILKLVPWVYCVCLGKGEQKYLAHIPLRRRHSDVAVIQGKHIYPPSLPAEAHWSQGKSPAQHN